MKKTMVQMKKEGKHKKKTFVLMKKGKTRMRLPSLKQTGKKKILTNWRVIAMTSWSVIAQILTCMKVYNTFVQNVVTLSSRAGFTHARIETGCCPAMFVARAVWMKAP